MYISDADIMEEMRRSQRLPSGPGTMRANGGRIEWHDGRWLFIMDVDAIHRVAKRYRRAFRTIYPAEPFRCNPTPPFLASLGGFSHPDTRWYCAPRSIPNDVDAAWQGWGGDEGLGIWIDPRRAVLLEAPHAGLYPPAGPGFLMPYQPPFWLEVSSDVTGGRMERRGPFATWQQAAAFADRYYAARATGYFDIVDSKGLTVDIREGPGL